MKMTIRRSCFETNSSSAHSLTWEGSKDYRSPLNVPIVDDIGGMSVVPLTFGEFGWSYKDNDCVATQFEKLQYLLTMAYCTELNPKFRFKDQPPCHGYLEGERQEKPIDMFACTDGYQMIQDFLKSHGTDGIDEDYLSKHLAWKHINPTDLFPDLPSYWFIKTTDEDGGFGGYIDHQSYEDYESLAHFLKCNETTIEEFVLNPNAVMLIRNDNTDYSGEEGSHWTEM